MGARGPRKKLAELDRLDGNPSRRLFVDPSVSALGEAFIPEHLDDEVQACIEVIKRSMPPRVYATLDSFLLAGFATAWSEHRRAALEISAPGFERIVRNAAGTPIRNPWLAHLSQSLRDMMAAGDRLGLDPKARTALQLPTEKSVSKFDGLLGPPSSSATYRN